MPGFVFGVAKLLQNAAVALGFARITDCAPVMDDLMREPNPAALGQNSHQLLFYLLWRIAFGQAEAARDAEDVRVHYHAFSLAIGDAENHVGCLARRAGNGDEFGKRLRNLAAKLGNHFAGRALNRLGLVAKESGGSDEGF